MFKTVAALAALVLLSGCSTTYVEVHKTVYAIGFGNNVEQGGADLKDNKLDQKSEGTATVPLAGG